MSCPTLSITITQNLPCCSSLVVRRLHRVSEQLPLPMYAISILPPIDLSISQDSVSTRIPFDDDFTGIGIIETAENLVGYS